MRVVILTGNPRGVASLAVPRLAAEPDIDLALVVHVDGRRKRNWSSIKRNGRKLRQIGVLDALNGVRMRTWYRRDMPDLLNIEPIGDLCRRHDIPLHTSPTTNGARTRRLLRDADCDIGLSLGNPYIASRIFTTPRLGMLNIHHETLPAFQGAASVMWQLHEGLAETGYAVHQAEKKIDDGAIYLVETFPIEFLRTLRETTVHNVAQSRVRSIDGLVRALRDFDPASAKPQTAGDSRWFTTPTIRQYARMARQHARLRDLHGHS
jgi:methionyl-tRNA formyltransferase